MRGKKKKKNFNWNLAEYQKSNKATMPMTHFFKSRAEKELVASASLLFILNYFNV